MNNVASNVPCQITSQGNLLTYKALYNLQDNLVVATLMQPPSFNVACQIASLGNLLTCQALYDLKII